MLPAVHRLRRSGDFTRTVRQGVRAGRPAIVVHLVRDDSGREAQVGFVVSKAVGVAVVRNKVKRRLRALSAMAVPRLDPGTTVVVRALPAAAEAGFHDLSEQFTSALSRCLRQQVGGSSRGNAASVAARPASAELRDRAQPLR